MLATNITDIAHIVKNADRGEWRRVINGGNVLSGNRREEMIG